MTTFSPVLEESTDADNAESADDQAPTANSTSALIEGEKEGEITNTAAAGEERPKIRIIVDDNEHPYDEIPGAPKRTKKVEEEGRDLVIANLSTFRAAATEERRRENDDDDDEEKVYDEIPPPLTPDDSSISSQGINAIL